MEVANLIMKKASYCILFPNTLIFLNYPRSNTNATSLAFCCCFQRINVSATKIIIFFLYINTNKRKLQIERVTVLFSEDNLCFLFWLAIETSGPNSLFQCINTSTTMLITKIELEEKKQKKSQCNLCLLQHEIFFP